MDLRRKSDNNPHYEFIAYVVMSTSIRFNRTPDIPSDNLVIRTTYASSKIQHFPAKFRKISIFVTCLPMFSLMMRSNKQ